MMHHVYVLRSLRDGKLYIGLTNDLDRRIHEHNDGKVAATKGRRPLLPVWVEHYPERKQAASREKFLKSGVGRKQLKELLIK